MAGPTHLTTVDVVHERGSWLCTVEDPRGDPEEVVLVPCEDGVRAWVNTCTHEYQRLDRGGETRGSAPRQSRDSRDSPRAGAVIREGEIVCPKHGSLFDTCDGSCDNGPAAGSPLIGVDVVINRGDVYLTDDGFEFVHEGGIDEGDDGPDSTSHLRF